MPAPGSALVRRRPPNCSNVANLRHGTAGRRLGCRHSVVAIWPSCFAVARVGSDRHGGEHARHHVRRWRHAPARGSSVYIHDGKADASADRSRIAGGCSIETVISRQASGVTQGRRCGTVRRDGKKRFGLVVYASERTGSSTTNTTMKKPKLRRLGLRGSDRNQRWVAPKMAANFGEGT